MIRCLQSDYLAILIVAVSLYSLLRDVNVLNWLMVGSLLILRDVNVRNSSMVGTLLIAVFLYFVNVRNSSIIGCECV